MVGIQPLICEAIDEYNKNHALIMAQNLLKQDLPHYTICNIACNPNCPVDIIEESKPLQVAKLLARAGKKVTVKDRSSLIKGSKFSY